MFMYFAIKGWSFSQAIYCFLINPVMTITIPEGYFSMPTVFMFFSAFLVYTPHLPVSPDIHTIMAVAAIRGTDLLFRVPHHISIPSHSNIHCSRTPWTEPPTFWFRQSALPPEPQLLQQNIEVCFFLQVFCKPWPMIIWLNLARFHHNLVK